MTREFMDSDLEQGTGAAPDADVKWHMCEMDLPLW